jgi:predicted HTH domain antitoxin
MSVSIDIPKQAEDVLRKAFGDTLNRSALEALAIEGYRSGKLSQFEVQEVLGFTSHWETEERLGERGIHLNYSVADLEADRRTIDGILAWPMIS